MHILESALFKHLEKIVAEHSTLESTQSLEIIIAFSGGLDSSALLHAAYHLMQSGIIAPFSAVHVNHGLQVQADEWQAHCQKICNQYQIPLLSKAFDLAKQGKTSEADARSARYQFFEHCVNENQLLLFAHHSDDQAETTLFRLCRGTGIHGMAGIPRIRKFSRGFILRPWLEFSRNELSNYANECQLIWVNDPSNQSNQYSRNFIRNEVIPLLRSKWLTVPKSIAQFSRIARDQIEILDDVAEQDRQSIETKPAILDILALANLSHARQRNLLHFWVKKYANYAPATAEIDEVIKQLFSVVPSPDNNEKSIKVKAGGGWVRSFDHQLFYYLTDEPKVIQENTVWLDINRNLRLDNELVICAKFFINASDGCDFEKSITTQNLPVRLPNENEIVSVRPRIGGELAQPEYRQHSTELKKIYQELRVPSWKRKWLPIIYYNDQLVSVPGIFSNKNMQVEGNGIVYYQKKNEIMDSN